MQSQRPITSIEAQLPPPQHLSSLKTRHNFEGVNAELQCCYLSCLDYGLAGRQFGRWSKGVLVVGGLIPLIAVNKANAS